MHLQRQAQRHAGQRVVAIEHHMLGVNLRHGVERIARCLGIDPCRQGAALEGQALLQLRREQRARLQEQQLLVIVAKCLFRLQVQRQLRSRLMAL